MEAEIAFSCSPPDPKTQPKITTFFTRTTEDTTIRDAAQPKITAFFEESPTTSRTRAGKTQRSVMKEPSPDCSTEDEQTPQPKKRKVGRPRKITNETPAKVKRPVGRPRKDTTAAATSETAQNVTSVRPARRPRKMPSVEPVEHSSAEEATPPADILLQETTVLTVESPLEKLTTSQTDPPSVKQTVKQTRTSHSIEKKQEVVEYAKKHSIYKASIHYNLSCGTIGPWVKKDFSNIKGNKRRFSGGGRKLSYPPEIEAQLTEWILEQRDIQPNLSTQAIVDHASSLIQPLCPTFKGTRGWLHKFLARNNLLDADNTPLNNKLPGQLEEKILTFLESIKTARNEYDYPRELIGNMDEVSVQFDMASNRKAEKSNTTTFPTYTVGGETRSYTVGAEKQYVTVVLTATADGNLLPPIVIFRGSNPPKIIGVPSDWIVCAQANAQLDTKLMEIWIKDIWLKHTQGRKALLILDSHHPHCKEDYQSLLIAGNTTVGVIPHGCSSKLQPVAISLAKALNDVCSKCTELFYHSQLSSLSSSGDKLRSASRRDIVVWLKRAFRHVSEMQSVIVNLFKATGLTLALDGSESHLLRNTDFKEKMETSEVEKVIGDVPDITALEDEVIIGGDSENTVVYGESAIERLYNYVLQIQNKTADLDVQTDEIQA